MGVRFSQVVGADDSVVAPTAALWWSRNGQIHVTPVYEGRGAVLYASKSAADDGTLVVADTMQPYLADHVAAMAPTTVVDLHLVEPGDATGVGTSMARRGG